MSAAHPSTRPYRLRAAALLVLTAVLTLPAGPVRAVAAPGPALALAPSTAQVGSAVSATGTGFDDCVGASPVDEDSSVDPALPAAGTVTFSWPESGAVLGEGQVSGGTATATVQVPDAALPGRHEVRATCRDNEKLVATETLSVVPRPVLVVVPNLRRLPRDEAQEWLESRGLQLGEVGGSGGTVVDQTPLPQTEVPPGTRVSITLGRGTRPTLTPTPTPTVVPTPTPTPDARTDSSEPVSFGALVDDLRLPALLVVLAAAALLGVRRGRVRSDRRWIRSELKLRPRAGRLDADARPDERDTEPDVEISLRWRADGGTQTLEEHR
jgi:hypothetical protein